MRELSPLAGPLLLATALIMVANGLQTTLLGVRADLEGFTPFQMGMVLGAYYLGYLVGSRKTPGWVGRVGHVAVFASWAALASVAVLLHGLWVEPWGWAAFRALSGFCFAGMYVVLESWLNAEAPESGRARLLSAYMVVQYAGLLAGQAALNLAPIEEVTLFALASALLSVAAIPLALGTGGGPAREGATNSRSAMLSVGELWRAAPEGLLACAVCGVATGALLGTGPVYARHIGLGVGDVALFMSALLVSGMVLQYPVGQLADRMPRARALKLILALTAGAGLLAALLATGLGERVEGAAIPWAVTGAAMALAGVGLSTYAVGVAMVQEALGPAERVAASSTLLLVFGAAAALGPVVVTQSMALVGGWTYFGLVAGVHLAALLAVGALGRGRPRGASGGL